VGTDTRSTPEQVVEDQSEGIHIDALVHGLAGCLFRRHVFERADDPTGTSLGLTFCR
jgi:hypothetical protein